MPEQALAWHSPSSRFRIGSWWGNHCSDFMYVLLYRCPMLDAMSRRNENYVIHLQADEEKNFLTAVDSCRAQLKL